MEVLESSSEGPIVQRPYLEGTRLEGGGPAIVIQIQQIGIQTNTWQQAAIRAPHRMPK